MMWWGTGPGGWASWLLMTLVTLAFWGGLIALIVWAIRGTWRSPEPKSDARSILEERFARGEIDAEEFEARLKVLGSGKRSA